jgi:hypothetical protein
MLPSKRFARVLTLTVLAMSWDAHPVHAQSPPPAATDSRVHTTLIKNALTAVNHANITGNYTVLRDLGSERFRQRNKAADLAITFRELRQQKIDLSPILALEPQLTRQPVESQGRLQLVGFFPTRPLAVQFGLVFQRVEEGWMIDEIALQVGNPEAKAAPPAAQHPASSPPPQSYRPPERPAVVNPIR